MAVVEFHMKHKNADLQEMFMSKKFDADFTVIGRAARGKLAPDDHRLAWVGYEILSRSKYADQTFTK